MSLSFILSFLIINLMDLISSNPDLHTVRKLSKCSIGIGFLNGRNDDKQLQQSYIKDIAFKGTVSQVTNKDILIKIDTVSNSNVIFPTEYIPAFEFQISSKQTCLLLNRKRLKLYNIKVGNNVNKKAGTDSITIGSISYSLFD